MKSATQTLWPLPSNRIPIGAKVFFELRKTRMVEVDRDVKMAAGKHGSPDRMTEKAVVGQKGEV